MSAFPFVIPSESGCRRQAGEQRNLSCLRSIVGRVEEDSSLRSE
jgi:hypothetical protein